MEIKLVKYVYRHTATNGSIGYFSCVPEDEPDFASALELLSSQPYNSFLHNYILELCISEFGIIKNCTNLNNPVLRAIIGELLLLNPSSKAVLQDAAPEYADNLLSYTPLPLLIFTEEVFNERRRASEIWRAHLEKMTDLKKEALAGCELFVHNPVYLQQSAKDTLNCEFEKLEKNVDKSVTINPEFWKHIEQKLKQTGLGKFPEMRHEASLSPIALLRQWPFEFQVLAGQFPYIVSGTAISYGRGLKLAQARASLRMEIIERASALAKISKNYEIEGLQSPVTLCRASLAEFERSKIQYFAPFPAGLKSYYKDVPFFWFPGKNLAGETVYIPCQAVFLFCNLDEPTIFETGGSTGLGAGETPSQAKVSGLLEIIERDANAVTPFSSKRFFRLTSRDELLRQLFEDYAARHIYPMFQDITTELGIPAYRCVIKGLNGEFVQATAAKLSGKQAALAALTETPWPYSWATPAPFGKPTARPNADMPVRFLEDLPDFDPGSDEIALQLLENTLIKLNLPIYYCELTRTDFGFPVYRAFIEGLETHAEFDAVSLPSARLLKNCHLLEKQVLP